MDLLIVDFEVIKENITNYTDRELTLIVYNSEFWYYQRFTPHLITLLDEAYIYTKKQLNHLNDTLNEEKEDK